MEIELTAKVDNLCDYTYNFAWLSSKLKPENTIPFQKGTGYTYKDLVDELRKGGEVSIHGSAGRKLAYSMGADLKHFGGTGLPEKAGKIYVEGDVSAEMGMGMVSGVIYVKGSVEEPLGNVLEVASDEQGYRKFRAITEILCNGLGKDALVKNKYDEQRRHLLLGDGVLRGTIASRCNCEAFVEVEGDVYNGTGLLMKRGVVHVKGNAGMNTGAHLDGGVVIVEGTSEEFAGAYMKKGVLILKDAKGYVGANMKDGMIFTKKKVKTSPPVEELDMLEEDAGLLVKHLELNRVEAMSYCKYGLAKERLVRMRDGSVVVSRVE